MASSAARSDLGAAGSTGLNGNTSAAGHHTFDGRPVPSRVLSPASSDAGSYASSTVDGRRESSSTGPRRLGSLHGAGLSSLSLALGSDAGFTAGSSLVGFNAISTLLNNPNKPQRPIDPSSSRYPALSQSHTELPKVRRADYATTIDGLKAEWNRYQRNIRLGKRGQARLKADGSVAEDAVGDVTGDLTIDGEEEEGGQQGENGASHDDVPRRALGKKRLPPLSTVPQVFFSEDFDLGNPYTFDLVTERYKAVSSAGNGTSSNGRNGSAGTAYDVALNQMLQEKLSYYSDVVEQHLILEISARSSSFFAALGNLQDLEHESRSCLDKVEELKVELDERDEGIAKAGLRLLREQARRREMEERLEAVGLMNQLCEKRNLCQLLVQNSEWSEALDVMGNLQDIIEGKAKLMPRVGIDQAEATSSLSPHVDLDLSSIAAVQALGPQLKEMQSNIASQLQVELLNVMTTDLEQRIGHPEEATSTVLSDIDPSVQAVARAEEAVDVTLNVPSPIDVARIELSEEEQQLADRLSAHVRGLIRTGGIDAMVDDYKEAALKSARQTMRTFLQDVHLPTPVEGAGSTWLEDLATLLEDDEAAQGKADARLGPGGIAAANRLKGLEQEPFLALLRTLVRGLTACIKSVDCQRRVLVHLLNLEARKTTSAEEDGKEATADLMMPQGVSPSLPNNLASIVADVCSATHILTSRLLSLRSATHTTLSLRHFLAVFHLSWTFVLESEALCGRMIIGLRGVVLNQAKAWLGNFHKTRIERAAKAVEEEQWAQAEVSKKQQTAIELVIESATVDPAAFLFDKVAIQSVTEQSSSAPEMSEEADAIATLAKTLNVEDKQFYVVKASLDVLEMLTEYLQVVVNLPLLCTEIMGRVVEFLKQFNSRTCQVVLGAGAMRSAGLKNITAKHLALASQSLSIMISLIPYIREAIRRHLNVRQAVMLVEFDKLKRDYQEHQYEIHAKLVAIMSDRLTVHCRALVNIDWSAPLTSDETPMPVRPITDLVKETATLHKVLCKYLQPNVVETVIGQVLLSIDKRVAVELRKIDTHDEATIKRVSVNLEHFNERFGALKHVEWSAKDLEESMEEIRKVPPLPPPAPINTTAKATANEEAAPSSPAQNPLSPPSYKPRLSLFARKQQQQQQKESEAKRSLDIPVRSSSTLSRPSEESVRNDATPSGVSVDLTTVAETPAEEKVTAEPSAAATEPAPASAQEIEGTVNVADASIEAADTTVEEQPPATPSKDISSRPIKIDDNDESTPIKGGESAKDLTADAKVSDDRPTRDNVSPATPAKDRPVVSTATVPATSAAEQGATTPMATASVISPTSTGRMTLQQRLAEAARRRAQGGSATSRAGSSSSRPPTPQNETSGKTETTPSAMEAETASKELPAEPATEAAKEQKQSESVEEQKQTEQEGEITIAAQDTTATPINDEADETVKPPIAETEVVPPSSEPQQQQQQQQQPEQEEEPEIEAISTSHEAEKAVEEAPEAAPAPVEKVIVKTVPIDDPASMSDQTPAAEVEEAAQDDPSTMHTTQTPVLTTDSVVTESAAPSPLITDVEEEADTAETGEETSHDTAPKPSGGSGGQKAKKKRNKKKR